MAFWFALREATQRMCPDEAKTQCQAVLRGLEARERCGVIFAGFLHASGISAHMRALSAEDM